MMSTAGTAPVEIKRPLAADGQESAARQSVRYLSSGMQQPASKNPFADAMSGEELSGSSPSPDEAQLSDRAVLAKLIDYLLSGRFYLTALELYAELSERGESSAKLSNFFSNPGNFEPSYGSAAAVEAGGTLGFGRMQRSPSITTFDSFDAGRNSDNGDHATDERMAVLEFELRKAKETIGSLRQELTEHARGLLSQHRVRDEDELNEEAEEHSDDQLGLAAKDAGSASASAGQSANDNGPSTAAAAAAAGVGSDDAELHKAIEPHERRILNYLIYEYLLMLDYKYTPVTFAEENADQIFDSWDDVGLNMPKPRDLLRMLRSSQSTAPAAANVDSPLTVECVEADCQTEPDAAAEQLAADWSSERQELRERIDELEELIDQLKAECAASKQRALKLENDLYRARERSAKRAAAAAAANAADSAGRAEAMSVAKEVEDVVDDDEEPSITATSRTVPLTFTRRLYSSVLPFALEESLVTIGTSPEELVRILGHVLPCLIPGVLFDYRHLTVPLAVHTACLHPDSGARDQLLRLLFNIAKSPDRKQRNEIIEGCLSFAKSVGPNRLEAELLPQIWEQLGHKTDCRRLLVVEACSTLIPLLTAALRDSLVFSMLQQMFEEERNVEVRCALVKALALLACYMEDADKYNCVLRIMQACLLELPANADVGVGVGPVADAATNYLLPAVCSWCLELGNMHNSLLDYLLTMIDDNLAKLPLVTNALVLSHLLQLLVRIIPFITVWIVRNLQQATSTATAAVAAAAAAAAAPGTASTSSGSLFSYEIICPGYKRLYKPAFRYHCTQPAWESWPQVGYLQSALVPRLLSVLQCANIGEAHCTIVCQLLARLSKALGASFIQRTVAPLFRKQLYDTQLAQLRAESLETCLLAGYCVCLLSCCQWNDDDDDDDDNEGNNNHNHHNDHHNDRQEIEDVLETEISDEVQRVLLDSTVLLAKGGKRLNGLCACLKELCSIGRLGEQSALRVLWDSLLSPDATVSVRLACCRMCNALLHNVDESVVQSDLIKALVTLASDPDAVLRRACLRPLGNLASMAKSAELLDKAHVQIREILLDPGQDLEGQLEVANFCATFGPKVDQRFREEVLLPVLERQVSNAIDQFDQLATKSKLLLALFEAYSALSCSYLSESAIELKLLPGLRSLSDRLANSGQSYHCTVVQAILQDLEAKHSQAARLRADSANSAEQGAAANGDEQQLQQQASAASATATATGAGVSLVDRLKDIRDGKNTTRSLFSRRK